MYNSCEQFDSYINTELSLLTNIHKLLEKQQFITRNSKISPEKWGRIRKSTESDTIDEDLVHEKRYGTGHDI